MYNREAPLNKVKRIYESQMAVHRLRRSVETNCEWGNLCFEVSQTSRNRSHVIRWWSYLSVVIGSYRTAEPKSYILLEMQL